MARGLAFLFAAGATLVAITLLLPHSDTTTDPALWAAIVLAYVTAVALVLTEPTVGVLHALLASGTTLIGVCVGFGGQSGYAYPLMYVWVSLYAGLFFPWRAVLAHIAYAGATYAACFALQEHTPVPGIYWLMGMGTVLVAGALVARLTHDLREQARDLAVVARLASEDVPGWAQATTRALRAATRADAVLLLEPHPDSPGLTATAIDGEEAAAAVLDPAALEHALLTGQPVPILDPARAGGARHLLGTTFGLAQPVLRDGRAAGVLAMVWVTPRRRITERVSTAALQFAVHAGSAMERAARRAREQERRALEINDTIVQGLVVAKYALQAGQIPDALRAIEETLDRARKLITDGLDEVSGTGDVRPGDLVRRF